MKRVRQPALSRNYSEYYLYVSVLPETMKIILKDGIQPPYILYESPDNSVLALRKTFADRFISGGWSPIPIIIRFVFDINRVEMNSENSVIIHDVVQAKNIEYFHLVNEKWESLLIFEEYSMYKMEIGDDPQVIIDDLLRDIREKKIKNPFQKEYRKITIKKRNGKVRIIYAPSKEWKEEMRTFLPKLNSRKYGDMVHGFIPLRSPVTNAIPHIGYSVSISMDIQDFFDNVEVSQLSGKISKDVMDVCLLEGKPRQGLPTSPAIANIAASKIDERIVHFINKLNIDGVYTRYADDLTFSLNDTNKLQIREIIKEITKIIKNNRFTVNEKKTKIQYASSGLREICGVLVGENNIKPLRKHRKRVRAMEMNKEETSVLDGLKEWNKLKIPKQKIRENKISEKPPGYFSEERFIEAQKIAKKYKIRIPKLRIKSIPEMTVDNNFCITNDPVMFMCMSASGNSWTSCMNIIKSSHAYKKGVTFFQYLKGVSLAILWGSGTVNIAGVIVRKMAGRCLIYQLENGSRAYGRIYGGAGAEIRDILEKIGFKSASELHGKVEGFVPKYYSKPYFDYGKLNPVHEKVVTKTISCVKLIL